MDNNIRPRFSTRDPLEIEKTQFKRLVASIRSEDLEKFQQFIENEIQGLELKKKSVIVVDFKDSLMPNNNTKKKATFLSTLKIRIVCLAILFVVQVILRFLLDSYDIRVQHNLTFFSATLITTGISSGSQSSNSILQILFSNQIISFGKWVLLAREILMAVFVSSSLSTFCITCLHVYYKDSFLALSIGISLFLVVNLNVMMGAVIPLLLYKWKIDPVVYATPIVITIGSILGIVIVYFVSSSPLLENIAKTTFNPM